MSTPAEKRTLRTIQLDKHRSIQLQMVNGKVELCLLAIGIKTFTQSIDCDIAFELGCALQGVAAGT